jgi:hypothetical protein
MFTVVEHGTQLHLCDTHMKPVAKFSKPGSSMQPGGGVFWYKPLEVSKAEAEATFKRHLASTPARVASTVGAR